MLLLLLFFTITTSNVVNGFVISRKGGLPTIITRSIIHTNNNNNLLPTLLQQQQQQRQYFQAAHHVLFAKHQKENEEVAVKLSTELTDEKIKELFAWITKAFDGNNNPQYNNLMLAIAAVFGTNLDESTLPRILLKQAMIDFEKKKNDDKEEQQEQEQQQQQYMGYPFRLYEREQNSLGAMGAGQWMGQYKTRPHALLNIQNYKNINDWIKTLPRGCKRTLKKVNTSSSNNNELPFTVTTRPIHGNQPAPHSTLEHFQCVVEHEVRLLSGMLLNNENENDDYYQNVQNFFYALEVAISRYIETTQMYGEIQEYRSNTSQNNNKVIAFAHEIVKGKTIRGQWFYATNEASKSYVWFHSVQELVKRAIETSDIDVVDLGKSGSDAFSLLKERYGFQSIDDWPSYADYVSLPFRHISTSSENKK